MKLDMVRRLLALWLVLPPATQVWAWLDVCASAGHCGHEFCSCREHCDRKPSAPKPCHEKREAPTCSIGDACHSQEEAQLLALSTYLLPDAAAAAITEKQAAMTSARASRPLLGFQRLDLPPPRSATL
jgi:hypothetical protein